MLTAEGAGLFRAAGAVRSGGLPQISRLYLSCLCDIPATAPVSLLNVPMVQNRVRELFQKAQLDVAIQQYNANQAMILGTKLEDQRYSPVRH